MRPRRSVLVLLASITAMVVAASGIQAAAVPSGSVRAAVAATMASTAAQRGTAIPGLPAGGAAAGAKECAPGPRSAGPSPETAARCSFPAAAPSARWQLVPRAGAVTAACQDLVVRMDGSAATLDNLKGVINGGIYSGPGLSDYILKLIDDHQLLAPLTGKTSGNWASFGGQVSASVDLTTNLNVLSADIPCADVHTNIPGWVATAIAAVIGLMSGALAAAICIAAAGPGSVLCSLVQGYVTAFVWTLVSGVLTGGTLYSAEAWANALAAGIVGGLGAAAWSAYGLPWAAAHMRPLLITIGTAVANAVRAVGSWLGGAAAAAADYVATTVASTARWIVQKMVEFGEKLGVRTAQSNIRLMPLGDSITAGFQSTTGNGYRLELWNDLANEGHTVLKFVGSQDSGTMADPANEGHSGDVISDLENPAIGTADPAAYRPNIVTLMIGTNDMGRDVDPAGAPERLKSLINQVLAAAPDATVVVASLVPSGDAATEARVQTYNAAVPGVVDSLAAAGEHVLYVNMDDVTTADLKDGIHPNDTGYNIVGDVFNDGVEEAIAAGWVGTPVATPGTCAGGPRDPIWFPQGNIGGGAGYSGADIQFADINGDGRADFLGVNPANGAVSEWQNGGPNPAGGWIWYPMGQIASGESNSSSHVVFADINGDGRADYLVVDNVTGATTAWLNGGPNQAGGPIWMPIGQIASGTSNSSSYVRFADINGDHRADYLVVDKATGAVTAWLNGGPNSAGGPIWYPQGQIASGTLNSGNAANTLIDFADVECDGRAAYLEVNQTTGAVDGYLNGGPNPAAPGSWIWYPHAQFAAGVGAPSTSRVIFADLNGDGRADYISVAAGGPFSAWLS